MSRESHESAAPRTAAVPLRAASPPARRRAARGADARAKVWGAPRPAPQRAVPHPVSPILGPPPPPPPLFSLPPSLRFSLPPPPPPLPRSGKPRTLSWCGDGAKKKDTIPEPSGAAPSPPPPFTPY